MTHRNFEVEIDVSGLTGTLSGGFDLVRIDEDDGTGTFVASNLKIRKERPWRIVVGWSLIGTMLNSPFFTLPGSWVVTAYLEGWGQSTEEVELPSSAGATLIADPPTNSSTSPPEWNYEKTINVTPADTPKEGPYKLVVTVTYRDENGEPGPIAGFYEHRMLQIYRGQP